MRSVKQADMQLISTDEDLTSSYSAKSCWTFRLIRPVRVVDPVCLLRSRRAVLEERPV